LELFLGLGVGLSPDILFIAVYYDDAPWTIFWMLALIVSTDVCMCPCTKPNAAAHAAELLQCSIARVCPVQSHMHQKEIIWEQQCFRQALFFLSSVKRKHTPTKTTHKMIMQNCNFFLGPGPFFCSG